MTVDRSHIRVKALLIAPEAAFAHHVVNVNAPTAEDPDGFHRLIGGSVELGETHREAIVREVDEELGAEIRNLTYLAAVENIFRMNGTLGHEIVFLYTGLLDPSPGLAGAHLTESDGSVQPVVWRPVCDERELLPLYPRPVAEWVRSLATSRRQYRAEGACPR